MAEDLASAEEATGEEVELLQAMFEGCTVEHLEKGRVELAVPVVPALGESSRRCGAHMLLTLSTSYPASSPDLRLVRTRGLVDKEERGLVQRLRMLLAESQGRRCLVEVVMAGVDAITDIASTTGDCAICLEGLGEGGGDAFHADCDHSFHRGCLAAYRAHLRRQEAEHPPTADPAASAEGRRLHAVRGELAQARSRLQVQQESATVAQRILDRLSTQMRALSAAEREPAAHVDKQYRSQSQALSAALQDVRLTHGRVAQLEERERVEAAALDQAQRQRNQDAALRTVPCPVCRTALAEDRLPSVHGALEATHPEDAGTCRVSDLPPDVIQFVRQVQAEHDRIARLQEAHRVAGGPDEGESRTPRGTAAPAAGELAGLVAP